MKALKVLSLLLLSSIVFFSCEDEGDDHTNYLLINGEEYDIKTGNYYEEQQSTYKVELKSSDVDNPDNSVTFRIQSSSETELKEGNYKYAAFTDRDAGEFGTIVVECPDVKLSEGDIDDSYPNELDVYTTPSGGRKFDMQVQFIKDGETYFVHARYEGEK